MATAADFVNEARSFIGTPYVWGGSSPKGFDCSGLVEYSLTRLGLKKVPRTSEQQYAWVDRVSSENVEAGDLVFFHFPGEQGAGHVAIFGGRGGRGPFGGRSYVIQAPAPGQDVQQVPFTPLPAGSHEWGGTILGYGRVPGLDYQALTLEGLWLHAGGPPKVARIMAAIALAESGGRVNAKGGPNADGSYDYGLWQINSSHGYNVQKLTHDPEYNARAAVAVFRSQGLQAWSTYTSGRYRAFLGDAGKATVSVPARPGDASSSGAATGGSGSSSSGSGDAAAAADAQTAAWAAYITESDTPPIQAAGGAGVQQVGFFSHVFSNPFGSGGILGGPTILPGVPNPLSIFGEAQAAVNDVGTFLKWISWIFSPRNILRVVEFVSGFTLILVAIYLGAKDRRGSSSSSSGPTGVRKATFKRAVRATPAGRAVALAQAGQRGRRKARSARRLDTSKRHRAEEKRAEKRSQARARQPGESRADARARNRGDDVPF